MARSKPTVKVIPAKKPKLSAQAVSPATRRRVSGYSRVSTDKDEQLNSYEAQVDYYTNYIKSRPDWEFAGMYTDEGLSALNTKHRDGFNRMIADALNGKIDLIMTKSVSRFARNTVDSLSTIRKLKEKGVEVYFEKEYISIIKSLYISTISIVFKRRLSLVCRLYILNDACHYSINLEKPD